MYKSQAMDLAPDGIRVNAVSPGWPWSNIMDGLTNGDREKTDKVGADYHLLPRVGDPEEVAQAVMFLCSDEASFVTGTDIRLRKRGDEMHVAGVHVRTARRQFRNAGFWLEPRAHFLFTL